MDIFIWGTGAFAKKYLSSNEVSLENISGFIEVERVDNNEFCGKKIYEPHELAGKAYDYILVCTRDGGQNIYGVAKSNGLNLEKMFFLDNCKYCDLEEIISSGGIHVCDEIKDNAPIKDIFPRFYEESLYRTVSLKRRIISLANGRDLVSPSLLYTEGYKTRDYFEDYHRYRTFELIADEIKKKNIAGNVAEVGVYQGRFARLIHETFSDRTMFLFDTFESFDSNELKKEADLGRCSKYFDFSNTSPDRVLNQMKYPERCIIRKGLFPSSAEGLEDERFSFVSIDVDLEDSIFSSLRWFYPRMNTGGIIFIHDYNNRFLQGVKVAIDRYEKQYVSLVKLPIADEGGTLVVYKI